MVHDEAIHCSVFMVEILKLWILKPSIPDGRQQSRAILDSGKTLGRWGGPLQGGWTMKTEGLVPDERIASIQIPIY